jgi:DNA-binding CsgD family transcriptional regulator
MGGSIYEGVVAALAEAPFESARWADALNGTAQLCRASSCQLISFGAGHAPVLIAPGFTDDDIGFYAALGGPDPAVNKGVARILRSAPDEIVADYQYMTESERRSDTLYNEFFRPHDGEYASFGILQREGSVSTVLNLLHHRRQGPLDDGDRQAFRRVMPAFLRAFQQQAILEGEAAKVAAGALDAVNAAAVLCDLDGCVHAVTARAESILRRGDILTVRRNCVGSHDPDSAVLLAAAVHSAVRMRPPPQTSTFVVRAKNGAPVRIDVAPLPGGRGAATVRPLAMVHIHVPMPTVRLDIALVAKAFGLTQAEAEVAEGLCNGLPSLEIASSRGVAAETVHSQVKAVLAKTGARTRGEIPKLLRTFVTHNST